MVLDEDWKYSKSLRFFMILRVLAFVKNTIVLSLKIKKNSYIKTTLTKSVEQWRDGKKRKDGTPNT